jgi:hypothetical protein
LFNTGALEAWQVLAQVLHGNPGYETIEKILVQAVSCQAVALDLRNGRGTVLVLRQMQYENGVRLITQKFPTSSFL